MVDVVIGLFEEGGYMVVIDGVIHDIALAPGFDEATIPEQAQPSPSASQGVICDGSVTNERLIVSSP